MPNGYNPRIHETLKSYIYKGDVVKFKELFDQIKKISQEDFNKYLTGSEDAGRGMLHWATMWSDSPELLEYLIVVCKADVNQADLKKRTPLSNAVDLDKLKSVEYLLTKHNADSSLKDINGDTPLHLAASEGHLEAILYLKCLGKAKIDALNSKGATPFHLAAKNSPKALQFLWRNYKDEIKEKNIIEMEDADGYRPIHWAAMDETGKNIHFLKMIGAKLDVATKSGKTIQDIAESWEEEGKASKAIAQLLNADEGFTSSSDEDDDVLLGGAAAAAADSSDAIG